MPVSMISANVFAVGAAHPERQMFDCLMPTPHGTTYNAYLVVGEQKTALIDAVDPEKIDELLKNLRETGVTKIDYLVILHTEQDHSGGTHEVLKHYPMAQVIASAKVEELMVSHIHMAEGQIKVVAEGDRLELGGKTLAFTMIPFAHWPDNTMVFLEEDHILFSSDLFGSHFSTPKDELISDIELENAAKSYYSEIMMPFRSNIAKYTAKTRAIAPRMIAPAHGPVWTDPAVILTKYEEWTGDKVKKMVTIPFVSMHESTRLMVDHIAKVLMARGISVTCHDLGVKPESLTIETGHFINDLADSAAVVFATPTILGGPHPAVAYAALIANAMRPKARYVGFIGSFGWGSKMADVMSELTGSIKAERLTTLMVKGLPDEADIARLSAYATDLADKVLAIPDLII